MRAVVLDPASADFEWLLERRRRLGLDIYDEMWEGVYHMAPMARSGLRPSKARFRWARLDA